LESALWDGMLLVQRGGNPSSISADCRLATADTRGAVASRQSAATHCGGTSVVVYQCEFSSHMRLLMQHLKAQIWRVIMLTPDEASNSANASSGNGGSGRSRRFSLPVEILAAIILALGGITAAKLSYDNGEYNGRQAKIAELQPTIDTLRTSAPSNIQSRPEVAITSHKQGDLIPKRVMISGTHKNLVAGENIFFYVHTDSYYLTPTIVFPDGTWKLDVVIGRDEDNNQRFDSGMLLASAEASMLIQQHNYVLPYLPEGTTRFNEITLQRQQ
jgi:hypothetical protein